MLFLFCILLLLCCLYIIATMHPRHVRYMRSLSGWIYAAYLLFIVLTCVRFSLTNETIASIVVVSRAIFFFDTRFLFLLSLAYLLFSSGVESVRFFYACLYFLFALLLYSASFFGLVFSSRKGV